MKHFVKDIMNVMCTEILADVCSVRYSGHRPSAVKNNKEFIVVRASKSIYDHGPFQRGSVFIDIYVRNLEGGLEHTSRLQSLLDKVDALFPITRTEEGQEKWRWTLSNPQLVISGDDDLGFTAWGIRTTLTINTTDNFKF